MTDEGIPFSRDSMRFFGTVSASATHDLKNVLAVIQENAGLLEDLCRMAERGRPLDPGRLLRLAAELQQQVRRGDRIVIAMNRLAHSVDEEPQAWDAAGLLEVLAVLSARFLAARGLALRISPPAAPVSLPASPFLLIRLLWSGLEKAASRGCPAKILEVSGESAGEGLAFRIRGFDSASDAANAFLAAAEARNLCTALGAAMACPSGTGEVVIRLAAGTPRAVPKDCDASRGRGGERT